jgi:hypothetical protein
MNPSVIRSIAISIAIGCLFSRSLNAAEDLTYPNPQTVLTDDIDGNGIPDKVIATFFTRPTLFNEDNRAETCKTVVGKFFRYTLYLNGRENGKVIFEASYDRTQTQRLAIGMDLNRDGRKDLVVNIGDESAQANTYLLQKLDGFKAVHAGEQQSPSYSIDTQGSLQSGIDQSVIAKWNRSNEVWTSNKYGWVTGECVALRSQPTPQSQIVELVSDKQLLGVSTKLQSVGDWIAIDDRYGHQGWINKKYFSFSSPVRWFK